jgi:cell division protein FtsB
LATDIEDQIDAIRDAIYEEIKDMTSKERTAYFNAIAEEAREKHNFRVVQSAAETTYDHSRYAFPN